MDEVSLVSSNHENPRHQLLCVFLLDLKFHASVAKYPPVRAQEGEGILLESPPGYARKKGRVGPSWARPQIYANRFAVRLEQLACIFNLLKFLVESAQV